MKKPFMHIFTWLLSFVLLVSSAGVPVFAHICEAEGVKEVSVVPVNGCCSGESTADDGCSAPLDCCQEDVKFVQTEIPAIKNQAQKAFSPQIFLIPVYKQFFQTPLYAALNSVSAENGPPILSSRETLSLISILRI